MTLWTSAAVAIACIYAAALLLWPILVNRSERFARQATWAAVFLLPFVGLIVEPWSDAYPARWGRVSLSIFGGIAGGLAGAYWRSPRRRRGFADYARFIVLGAVNPNLLNTPKGFTPPTEASSPVELLRLLAAVGVGGLALYFGSKLLDAGESRPWVVNYLFAVGAFSVFVQSLGQALLAVWHVLGYRGRPIGDNIWLSRTPADFWRRWSPPAHLGFYRYVYVPCGGNSHRVWATFMAFLVSAIVHEIFAGVGLVRVTGQQFAFFMVSWLGVMASPALERLARWGLPGNVLMRLATILFMLSTGTLMFATFNNFIPMYREPAWLAW